MPSPLPAAQSWPAVITTARLVLRPAAPDDAGEFTRLWTDPEVRRFLGGPVAGDLLPLYQRHFTSRPHLFTVTAQTGAVVLGCVSLDPASRFEGRREVSFTFLPQHWGHGYAREAVTAAVGWAFDHIPSDGPTVIALTQRDNSRSRRLLEAIGMRAAGSFVEWDAPQVMYSMEREDLRTGR
ncbi:GNAT family N-acetyltransferase [Streptomyces sp. NBC_01136]|uniref:GNAT family N-acetyltransferase n=1 Tax=unclassified Streptomyces TaxID=2593676 RepID=UPI00324A888F|nr:GNAT family N-acetyltransferase [Streptomyces sp. NBC_01136]